MKYEEFLETKKKNEKRTNNPRNKYPYGFI